MVGLEDLEKGEYAKRLVPASEDEIIALAERLWADPALRAIFERIGHDGDATEAEQAAIDAEIDAYRQGDIWDRDELHLVLAACLARQLAEGMIATLGGPEARAFIAEGRITRSGVGLESKPATVKQAMGFAKALMNDPETWKIFTEKKYEGEFTREQVNLLDQKKWSHQRKYGLIGRSDIYTAVPLLRKIAAGMIDGLESPEAIQYFKSIRHLRDKD